MLSHASDQITGNLTRIETIIGLGVGGGGVRGVIREVLGHVQGQGPTDPRCVSVIEHICTHDKW